MSLQSLGLMLPTTVGGIKERKGR